MMAALAAFALCGGLALAHDYQAGGLRIHHPATRATPPGAKVAVGYVSIRNEGASADRLLGGTFEAAGGVEMHDMKMDGEIMRMRQLTGGIDLPPGASIELKPGGTHLMFQDLKQPLQEGAMVKGTLLFEKAGAVAVEYKVESLAAKGDPHAVHK